MKRVSNLKVLAGAALMLVTVFSSVGCNDDMWRDGYIPPYPKQRVVPQVAMPAAVAATPAAPSVQFRAAADTMPGYKEDHDKKDPMEGDAASIARGKDIFSSNCAVCHGDQGQGDGVNAPMLPLRPRNLTQGVFLYGGGDGDLFRTVSEGIPPGPMQPWKSILDEKSVWDVVNYVKTLHAGGAVPAATK